MHSDRQQDHLAHPKNLVPPIFRYSLCALAHRERFPAVLDACDDPRSGPSGEPAALSSFVGFHHVAVRPALRSTFLTVTQKISFISSFYHSRSHVRSSFFARVWCTYPVLAYSENDALLSNAHCVIGLRVGPPPCCELHPTLAFRIFGGSGP